jgi:hypothetical protein
MVVCDSCNGTIILYTEKRNHFERVLYQYFEGIYYASDYKRNITISIAILFVRGETERKKNNKTNILRVRSIQNKKLLWI